MIDFTEKIDYSVVEYKGVSIGETLKLVNDSFSAYLFVMGFETDNTPIVEYRCVKYHEGIEAPYDAFEDGDVMPYPYSDWGEIPSMGMIHPDEIDNLEPLNIDPKDMPEGLYDLN